MPITHPSCAPFDPETLEAMGSAFVATCEALGLSDRADPTTKLVAQKIIELAQRGFKNPTALHLAAMKEFKLAVGHAIAVNRVRRHASPVPDFAA